MKRHVVVDKYLTELDDFNQKKMAAKLAEDSVKKLKGDIINVHGEEVKKNCEVLKKAGDKPSEVDVAVVHGVTTGSVAVYPNCSASTPWKSKVIPGLISDLTEEAIKHISFSSDEDREQFIKNMDETAKLSMKKTVGIPTFSATLQPVVAMKGKDFIAYKKMALNSALIEPEKSDEVDDTTTRKLIMDP